MIPARPFASALTAWSLIAGAFFTFVASVGESRAQSPGAACEDAAGIAVLPSPVAPWKGAPLRVLFTAENPIDGEFALVAPDGRVVAKSRERQGGPPYVWFAEVAAPAEPGRGGSSLRTAISRAIVPQPAGPLSRTSWACHVPAAGEATSANQK